MPSDPGWLKALSMVGDVLEPVGVLCVVAVGFVGLCSLGEIIAGLRGERRRARRKPAVAVAPSTVPAFADPGTCRWCNGHHATIDGADFCWEMRYFRRDLMAWSVTRRHLEYLKKTETLAS